VLCRVPVDSRTATPTGPVEIVAQDVVIDDFALTADGTAFIATESSNNITAIRPNGSSITVAGSMDSNLLEGPTSCRFARKADASHILFVSINGGQEEELLPSGAIPAAIKAVDLTGFF
jgi:hypothetical protein